MLVDIHIRNDNGTPGKLYDTVEREPIERKTGQWVVFDQVHYKVLTGVRPFIVIPPSALMGIREVKKAGRPRK
jgi:hypothetical protein